MSGKRNVSVCSGQELANALYSTDTATSDLHLFSSLQHLLAEILFDEAELVKTCLIRGFS